MEITTSQLILQYCDRVHRVFNRLEFDVYINNEHVYIATTNLKSNIKYIISYKECKTQTRTKKCMVIDDIISYYITMYYIYEYDWDTIPVKTLSILYWSNVQNMYTHIKKSIHSISKHIPNLIDDIKTNKNVYTITEYLLSNYNKLWHQ